MLVSAAKKGSFSAPTRAGRDGAAMRLDSHTTIAQTTSETHSAVPASWGVREARHREKAPVALCVVGTREWQAVGTGRGL